MNKSMMHLSTTQLVLPWNIGQTVNNSNTMFQAYHWAPGPQATILIVIVMLAFTLMPALCSLCYHFFLWREKARERTINDDIEENNQTMIILEKYEEGEKNSGPSVSIILEKSCRECQREKNHIFKAGRNSQNSPRHLQASNLLYQNQQLRLSTNSSTFDNYLDQATSNVDVSLVVE